EFLDSPTFPTAGMPVVHGYFPQAASLDTRADLGLLKGLHTNRVTASASGTNVQEESVDEPDTVKTDGTLLVRLRDDELVTYDVSGPSARQLSVLRLSGID